jgi:hypothetical protein
MGKFPWWRDVVRFVAPSFIFGFAACVVAFQVIGSASVSYSVFRARSDMLSWVGLLIGLVALGASLSLYWRESFWRGGRGNGQGW